MTPEESKMLAEFTRSELKKGEAFVRRSALVSLLARWSEKHATAAKEANDLKNTDDWGYHLGIRDTLADCIYDLRRELKRAGESR